MPSLERQLAERKELLVTRSALNRARVRYQLVALRARIPSRRTTVIGTVLFGFLRLGAARWIANAGRLLVLFRGARSVLRLFRRR